MSIEERIEKDLDRILFGIDKEECSHKEGWWETSTGAEAGAKVLAEVKEYVKALVKEITGSKLSPDITGSILIRREEEI